MAFLAKSMPSCVLICPHAGTRVKEIPPITKDPLLFLDVFDHDKGQKYAISGRRLHWIFF